MFASFRSELKKLLTIRSTYLISGFVLLFTIFLGLYVFGYQHGAAPLSTPAKPEFIEDSLYSLLSIVGLFSGITAILLVTHEYRYSTIGYTLTASRSRIKVFFSKMFVAVLYTTIMTLLVVAAGYVAVRMGQQLRGDHMVAQVLPIWELTWRFITYTWSFALLGFIIAMLIRGVIGAIVTFLLLNFVAENLLSLILKDNADYLPFKAVDAIGSTSAFTTSSLTHLTALCVVGVYVVVFGIVAAVLFVKRDAN